MSLETGSEIPLYDIEIGNRNGTITENSTNTAAITNKEVNESTPLSNNSLNLTSGEDIGRNTDILTQNVIKSSLIDSTNLSMHPFHGNLTEELNYSLKSEIDGFLYCHYYHIRLVN